MRCTLCDDDEWQTNEEYRERSAINHYDGAVIHDKTFVGNSGSCSQGVCSGRGARVDIVACISRLPSPFRCTGLITGRSESSSACLLPEGEPPIVPSPSRLFKSSIPMLPSILIYLPRCGFSSIGATIVTCNWAASNKSCTRDRWPSRFCLLIVTYLIGSNAFYFNV